MYTTPSRKARDTLVKEEMVKEVYMGDPRVRQLFPKHNIGFLQVTAGYFQCISLMLDQCLN